MKEFDDLVWRMTDRLRVDPELRMDVAGELLAHLEDSAEEFRQAGCEQEQAVANAIKALGDQREIADQLWQANRGRVRFRRAAKWAARAALAPAAVLVTLYVAGGFQGSAGLWLSMTSDFSGAEGAAGGPLARAAEGLPEEHRFIVLGDPSAGSLLEREKSVSDRWPDNPVYYGNYAAHKLSGIAFNLGANLSPEQERNVEDVLAALDHGEKIDPDNAIYNYAKAIIHILLSSTTEDDPGRTHYRSSSTGQKSEPCALTNVADPRRFAQGLEELRRGRNKPRCTLHTYEMMQRRIELLPPSRSLRDHLERTAAMIAVIIPCGRLHFRRAARSVCGYALQQAEAGGGHEAADLLEQVRIMGDKMAAEAEFLIELLVAWAIRETSLGHAVWAAEAAGSAERAQAARDEIERSSQVYAAMYATGQPEARDKALSRLGVLQLMLLPAIPGLVVDPEPMRTSEYNVADRAVLAGTMVWALVLAGLAAAVTAVSLLRFRRGRQGPKLLFVGWRRLGLVCLVAVIAPLAAYGLYSRLTGGREYGWLLSRYRVAAEYAAVVGLVVGLMVAMGFWAVRARAAEAGMPVPPRVRLRGRWPLLAWGGLVAAGVVAYLATWPVNVERWSNDDLARSGSLLAVAVAAALAAWAIVGLVRIARLRGELVHFRRTLLRSMVPVILAGAIVAGLVCGPALHQAEAASVRRVGQADFRYEIEQSNFRLIRDAMRAEHRQLIHPRPAEGS